MLSAEADNTLQDLRNSSYDTKAEFNNCFIIRSKIYPAIEHARDENVVTMEFLGHVSVIRCRRRSLPVSFAVARIRPVSNVMLLPCY